jgi:uncharacterized protein YndB with AHSA1/START domain
METTEKKTMTVRAIINAPVEKVWKCWTTPDDIIKWNHALDDWHTTHAVNDLRLWGKFSSRMEAKDGSTGFDFSGVYKRVILYKQIEYTLDDGREVTITFNSFEDKTEIIETFETENVYPAEMQREGWQAIMNNFKKYVEKNSQSLKSKI